MSGTVNYPKVIDHLTDVIKELNVPCAEAAPAAPSQEERQRDAADLVKALLSELEHGSASGGSAAAAGAAAAEHNATADKFSSRAEVCKNLFSMLKRHNWSWVDASIEAKKYGFSNDEVLYARQQVYNSGFSSGRGGGSGAGD
jgi:hypothetical protein